MTEPQAAICADTGDFGLFLTLTVVEGKASSVRRAIADFPRMTADLGKELAEPRLTGAVAIGASAWPSLFGDRMPRGLVPFAALDDGPRHAPATPADLFIHIHSPRHDANFLLARRVMGRLGGHVRLIEEVHGFKYLGGRDLTGFVDGTENPKDGERAEVALVGDEDPAFAGGSYVSLQRYVHDLPRWEGNPVAEQEKTIGRTKDGDEELADDVKPPTAHIARVVIEENGEELEVVRHSMPYGTTSESGLYFIAYCRDPTPFRRMLTRMVQRDGEGHYDRLLDFTRPVTGASFFAPPIPLLRDAAG
ncbi:MAG: Dyp-type peroxidase [Alphaproteobacteria bacterium]|nr:Dyp-type peroxidase [Alphaproteobacteria bacterium]